ncbi:MAG: tetratricopeptide repeat protein [Salegentibacter sp.]|uniref:Tetratricopeptide repeat-containing protein n=1 Tax=Salegentibacter flavus TaxID=287099 RepID=A0A1I4Z5Y2_9FLAO|nr:MULTISPECIES: tetratricopeptide repeat protein [Salegentibacter]MDR9456202.1 tetratricopeptide repeat protein [Salegentibacter sp.]SFN45608.1 Tetratricopeptide repeat-containing protein [Salegentibacter flavus]
MKINILTVALSLFTLVAVAQKSEIRNAGNAVEDGNYTEAKAEIKKAEPLLADANDKWKERFYLYKGQAYLGTGENVSVDDMLIASEAFQKAADMGSTEAQEGILNVRNSLVQSAVEDQNAENYKSASEKLLTSYELNPQDTLYLYYAAANSLNAQDYDTALEYYKELRDLGFDGAEVEYLATNVETGEQEAMPKEQRDLMVKTDEYTDPEDRKSPSKKGEIAKNIALIYISQEKMDEAIEAMEDAKRENPDNVMLIQAEADMYYQMGNKEKYNELMKQVLEKSSDDPAVYYNLGVTTAELGDTEGAIEYYEKALELDPDMSEARMNIVVAILAQEREIIDQMNQLGMSKEDNKRYEELEAERLEVYEEVIPYLEDAIEHDPTNVEIIRTAMNIFSALDEEEKAQVMKEKLEELQQ